jgi:hypothetical protein
MIYTEFTFRAASIGSKCDRSGQSECDGEYAHQGQKAEGLAEEKVRGGSIVVSIRGFIAQATLQLGGNRGFIGMRGIG